jgi:molybdate/tungstate transport system permease protein
MTSIIDPIQANWPPAGSMSRSRGLPLAAPALLAVPACILCVLPFAGLAWVTRWDTFHLAFGDGDAVAVSLGLGFVSIVLILLLGTPPALWLARTRSCLKPVVDLLVLAVLLTPPLGMGILLLSVYGPYATVGELLGRIGIELNNNAGAFILSQVYGGIAYFIMAATAAFEGVPVDNEEAAKVLGATGIQTFLRVTVPLAARGLVAGLIVAWVRVMGEFGIVTIFAYFPQGIPVKLYVNLQNEGIDQVYALLWLMLAVTLPLPLAGLFLLKRRGRR